MDTTQQMLDPIDTIQTRTINRLVLLRGFYNIAQKDMAQICAVSLRTYQRIEYGETELTLNMILRICRHFSLSPNYFFSETDQLIQEFIMPKQPFDCSTSHHLCLQLFKKISQEVGLLLKDKYKVHKNIYSFITMNDVHFSNRAIKELSLKSKVQSIEELSGLGKAAIKLGHEFMIRNADKVVVKICHHNYIDRGVIKTISVSRCVRKNFEKPLSCFIPTKIPEHLECCEKKFPPILCGVKYLYREKVLIIHDFKKSL